MYLFATAEIHNISLVFCCLSVFSLLRQMDAFGNAHWQKSCHTSNRMLEQTTNQLSAVQTERNNIEQQLLHKEQRFDAELRNGKCWAA